MRLLTIICVFAGLIGYGLMPTAFASSIRAPLKGAAQRQDVSERQILVAFQWVLNNDYRETINNDEPFMRFAGNGPGNRVAFTFIEDAFYFSFTHNFFTGQQAYEAFDTQSKADDYAIPLTEANIPFLINDLEFLSGVLFWPVPHWPFQFGVNMETGFAIRLYHDQFSQFTYDHQGTIAYGVDRETTYYSLPVRIGLSAKYLGIGLGATYTLQILLHGINVTHTSPRHDHAQSTGGGNGYEVALWYDFLRQWRVQLTYYDKIWLLDASNKTVHEDGQDLSESIIYHEPVNTTRENGVTFSVVYVWQ